MNSFEKKLTDYYNAGKKYACEMFSCREEYKENFLAHVAATFGHSFRRMTKDEERVYLRGILELFMERFAPKVDGDIIHLCDYIPSREFMNRIKYVFSEKKTVAILRENLGRFIDYVYGREFFEGIYSPTVYDRLLNLAKKKIKFVRSNPLAVLPSKANQTAIGYDLTLISLHEKISPNVFKFDTGIKVEPPNKTYCEIVPRSSMIKTGYFLTNSVGIIDPDYRGNIFVCLSKTSPEVADLELPKKICQLIVRRSPPSVEVIEIDEGELTTTERGEGGFGSTNVKN